MPNRTRVRQLVAITRNEAGRSLAGRRVLSLAVLAALPVVLGMLRALLIPSEHVHDFASTGEEFGQMFWVFTLRFIIFFGAARAFVKTFRAEIMAEILHWSLLAPVPRGVLVGGKYLGALVATALVLGSSTAVTWILFVLPLRGHLTGAALGVALGHGVTYVAITVLACATYGAIFLVLSLLVRSPMVAAAVLLLWELLTPFLPASLKVLTVVHHLSGVLPVPVRLGAFAIAADAPPAWLAVAVLLALIGGLLAVATWAARRLEIRYSAD